MKFFLSTLLALLMSFSVLLAQVPPPPDYQENAGPGSPSAVPVDQYVFILFGLAIATGIYFVWNKRKAFN